MSERRVTWQLPELESREQPKAPAAEPDYAALREEARQAGYDAGYAEGIGNGRARGEAIVAETTALWQAMTTPLALRDETVIRDLAKLVTQIAEAVVRAELRDSDERIKTALDEALACLESVTSPLVLRVNPADAALLGELMQERLPEVDWRLEEDPGQWRGGLHVTTPASYVDASMEQALARVCDSVLLASEHPDAGVGDDAAGNDAVGGSNADH